MTDYNELKKLAEAANIIAKYGWYQKYEAVDGIGDDADAEFVAACPPQAVLNLLDHIAQLEAKVAELDLYEKRFEWIQDNCRTDGGGHGFTIFVPVDHEDIGCGIDAAIAKSASKEVE